MRVRLDCSQGASRDLMAGIHGGAQRISQFEFEMNKAVQLSRQLPIGSRLDPDAITR